MTWTRQPSLQAHMRDKVELERTGGREHEEAEQPVGDVGAGGVEDLRLGGLERGERGGRGDGDRVRREREGGGVEAEEAERAEQKGDGGGQRVERHGVRRRRGGEERVLGEEERHEVVLPLHEGGKFGSGVGDQGDRLSIVAFSGGAKQRLSRTSSGSCGSKILREVFLSSPAMAAPVRIDRACGAARPVGDHARFMVGITHRQLPRSLLARRTIYQIFVVENTRRRQT